MPHQKLPRVRIRYSANQFELVSNEGEVYELTLALCTGRRVEWVYRGRSIIYTWKEEGYLVREDSLHLSRHLYAMLYALTTQIMKAVFSGYQGGKTPKQELPERQLEFHLFGASE